MRKVFIGRKDRFVKLKHVILAFEVLFQGEGDDYPEAALHARNLR